MTRRSISILPRALADAAGAAEWYDEQRDGLGLEFAHALDAGLNTISQFPELYPKVHREVRRCLLGRFPFGIFYELLEDDSILVVAVFHASRDPDAWREQQPPH